MINRSRKTYPTTFLLTECLYHGLCCLHVNRRIQNWQIDPSFSECRQPFEAPFPWSNQTKCVQQAVTDSVNCRPSFCLVRLILETSQAENALIGGDGGIKSHFASSNVAHCIQVFTNKSGQPKSNLEFAPLWSLGPPTLNPGLT